MGALQRFKDDIFGYQYTALMGEDSHIVVNDDNGYDNNAVYQTCARTLPAIVQIELKSPLLMKVAKEEKITLGGKIGTLGEKFSHVQEKVRYLLIRTCNSWVNVIFRARERFFWYFLFNWDSFLVFTAPGYIVQVRKLETNVLLKNYV